MNMNKMKIFFLPVIGHLVSRDLVSGISLVVTRLLHGMGMGFFHEVKEKTEKFFGFFLRFCLAKMQSMHV